MKMEDAMGTTYPYFSALLLVWVRFVCTHLGSWGGPGRSSRLALSPSGDLEPPGPSHKTVSPGVTDR